MREETALNPEISDSHPLEVALGVLLDHIAHRLLLSAQILEAKLPGLASETGSGSASNFV